MVAIIFALLVAFVALFSFLYHPWIKVCPDCQKYAKEIAYLQSDRSKLRRVRCSGCRHRLQQPVPGLFSRIWAFLLKKMNPPKPQTDQEKEKVEKKVEGRLGALKKKVLRGLRRVSVLKWLFGLKGVSFIGKDGAEVSSVVQYSPNKADSAATAIRVRFICIRNS